MTTVEEFAKRLKILRTQKSVSLKKAAEALGVTAQSLSLYENGMRTINIDLLKKVAQYFGVSSDYLIGLSDAATNDVDLKVVCDYLGLYEEAALRLQQINKRLQKKDSEHQYPKTTNECYKRCLNIFINEYLDDFLTEVLDSGIKLYYLEAELKRLNKQFDDEFNGVAHFTDSLPEEIDRVEEKADFCRYQTERTVRKMLKDYLERVNWGFMLIDGHKQLLEILEQVNAEEAVDNGEHQTSKE